MIALSDNEVFRQGIMLLKWGVPYECIFGQRKPWTRAWRNAAIMVINDFNSHDDGMSPN